MDINRTSEGTRVTCPDCRIGTLEIGPVEIGEQIPTGFAGRPFREKRRLTRAAYCNACEFIREIKGDGSLVLTPEEKDEYEREDHECVRPT